MSADRSSMKILRNPLADKAEKICQAERGFSLIEILGVLAIMGILAALLAPPLVRQLQQARSVNEDASLDEISRAIIESIKSSGVIPNPNVSAGVAGGWVNLAQPYSRLSIQEFQNSIRDNPNTERGYFLGENLMNYLDGQFQTPPDGYPETFPAGGMTMLLVSSSREDLLLPMARGRNLTDGDFDILKNWDKIYREGYVDVPDLIQTPFNAIWQPPPPPGQPEKDRGEFLHLKKVDCRDLFCRITLIDFAAPPSARTETTGTQYLSSVINVNVDGYTFQFSATGTGQAQNKQIPNNRDGLLISSSRTMISRSTTYPNRPIDDPAVSNENQAEFRLSVPLPPYWQIDDLTVQQMTGISNTQTFYILKNRTLKLYNNDSNVDTRGLILSLPIQSDNTFEYFNGSWTRKD